MDFDLDPRAQWVDRSEKHWSRNYKSEHVPVLVCCPHKSSTPTLNHKCIGSYQYLIRRTNASVYPYAEAAAFSVACMFSSSAAGTTRERTGISTGSRGHPGGDHVTYDCTGVAPQRAAEGVGCVPSTSHSIWSAAKPIRWSPAAPSSWSRRTVSEH